LLWWARRRLSRKSPRVTRSGMVAAAIVVIALLALAVLHQFYPHQPVVRWAWIALWVIYPVALIAFIIMMRRFRQSAKSRSREVSGGGA